MDNYFNGRYRIKSNRMSSWDYGSNGKYFVTICTSDKQNFFGEINNKIIALNNLGLYTRNCWESIPEHYPFVDLDRFIIMPNHIHGIILIGKNESRKFTPNKFGPQVNNLGAIIRGYKMAVTMYAKEKNMKFEWQPRYYDRIIRSDHQLNRIRNYILDNPNRWELKNNNH